MIRSAILLSVFLSVSSLAMASQLAFESTNSDDFATRIQYQPSRRPILLIPGIGGSILYGRVNGVERQIWAASNTIDEPVLGNSLAERLVGFEYDIYPKYTDNGLYGIYNVAPNAFIGSERGVYFKYIIDYLKKIGYVSGVDLFGHPYDWRKSIHDISEEERLDIIIKNYNPIIISHSMGGLVIEDYIRKNGDKNIHYWIGVATPFHGAAGNILKSFITGYNLGNTLVSNQVSKRIAENSFSAYNLLPYRMTTDPTISINNSQKNWLDYLSTLENFKRERIVPRSVVRSNKLHCITNSAIDTPFSYIKNIGQGEMFTLVGGDGTVPYESSKSYCTETNLNDPNLDHVGMLQSFDLMKWLLAYSDNSCLIDGEYTNDVDIIKIHNKIAEYNGSPISDYIVYTTCTVIKYGGRFYNRKIGNECNTYSSHTELTANGAKITRCIYGNYYDYVVVCNPNERYSLEDQQCHLDVDRMGRNVLSTAVVVAVSAFAGTALIVSAIYGIYKFITKRRNNIQFYKLTEEPTMELETLTDQKKHRYKIR